MTGLQLCKAAIFERKLLCHSYQSVTVHYGIMASSLKSPYPRASRLASFSARGFIIFRPIEAPLKERLCRGVTEAGPPLAHSPVPRPTTSAQEGLERHSEAPLSLRWQGKMSVTLLAATFSCLFCTVSGDQRIREGVVETLAGSGVAGAVDGAPTIARFNSPGGITTGADINQVYLADTLNHCLRSVVTASGSTVVSTVAGLCGTTGLADGALGAAKFNLPRGIAYSASDSSIVVADSQNNVVRKAVIATGQVTTIAGTGVMGFADGAAGRMSSPWGVCVSTSGTWAGIIVADRDNHAIRLIAGTTLITIGESRTTPGLTDGALAAARFEYPGDVQIHGGDLYFVQSHAIRKVSSSSQVVSTLAGSSVNDWVDGPALTARFYDPRSLWVAPSGDVFVTDKSHNLVRFFSLSRNTVGTLTGSAVVNNANVDGFSSVATLDQPSAVHGQLDPSQTNKFVIADSNHHRVKLANALCPYGCKNGGSCIASDQCQCPAQWTGKDCSEPVCTTPCTGNKLCSAPDTCTCPVGYTGASCATPVCNPTCKNGGTCTAPNTCSCTTGWSDVDCSFPICTGACRNGGNCTGPNQCTCPAADWAGQWCTIPLCTVACKRNTTCYAPQSCNCTEAPGYGGIDCSIPICAQRCVNGAVCTAPDTCSCAAGWQGALCDVPICTNACQNGGTCSAPDTCDCTGTGYSGALCTVPVCKSVTCENGATCTAPNNCTCTAGWKGSNCTEPLCDTPACGIGEYCMSPQNCVSGCTQTCINGGFCSGINKCTCVNGWEGHDCSLAFCRQHGCIRGVCGTPNNCTCRPGWEGPACDKGVCSKVKCQNRGRCVAVDLCACVDDWYGPNCTIPLCIKPGRPPDYYKTNQSDCVHGFCGSPNNCTCNEYGWIGEFCDEHTCALPCLNGGTCSAVDTCSCPPSYSGPQCELYSEEQPSWWDKNIATVLPLFIAACIVVGLFFCYRCRMLKDNIVHVAYQLEYAKKNRPMAQDLFSSSSEDSYVEEKRQDFEPTPTVVNKWTVGAERRSGPARRALRGVTVDQMDFTDSSDDTEGSHGIHVVREEKRGTQRRRSAMNLFRGNRAVGTDASDSSTSSSDVPGMVNMPSDGGQTFDSSTSSD